jgi:hypothetical protein
MSAWTPARRARQSQQIQRWKPWEKSTGPKSPEGKARSAKRGDKGGTRALLKAVAAVLRDQNVSHVADVDVAG